MIGVYRSRCGRLDSHCVCVCPDRSIGYDKRGVAVDGSRVYCLFWWHHGGLAETRLPNFTDTSGNSHGGAINTAIALNQIGQTTSWLGVELGRAGMAAAALRPAFAIQPACRNSPFPVLLACLYRFCSFLHSPVDSSCALLSDTHTQTQCQNVEPASSSNLARSVLLRLTCFAPPL